MRAPKSAARGHSEAALRTTACTEESTRPLPGLRAFFWGFMKPRGQEPNTALETSGRAFRAICASKPRLDFPWKAPRSNPLQNLLGGVLCVSLRRDSGSSACAILSHATAARWQRILWAAVAEVHEVFTGVACSRGRLLSDGELPHKMCSLC